MQILVIVIDSSFVEQVEESKYTCLNIDSSEILVSNIKNIKTKHFFMEIIIYTFKQSVATLCLNVIINR